MRPTAQLMIPIVAELIEFGAVSLEVEELMGCQVGLKMSHIQLSDAVQDAVPVLAEITKPARSPDTSGGGGRCPTAGS
jgi:hypothetical protein